MLHQEYTYIQVKCNSPSIYHTLSLKRELGMRWTSLAYERMEIYTVVEATEKVHVTLVIVVTVPLSQDAGMGHIAPSVINPYVMKIAIPFVIYSSFTKSLQFQFYPHQIHSRLNTLSDWELTK